MAATPAERQKAHRQRQAERSLRMEGALRAVLESLDGNSKPLAVKLRTIVQEGLKP
jgi:hypothetical protein